MGGRSVSLIISRMCSTDAEDMLPTSARDRRLAATAWSGSFSARCTASITLGPPGWQIQLAMSSTVRSCSARKPVTLSARSRSTTAGSSVVSTIRKQSVLSRQPSASPLSG